MAGPIHTFLSDDHDRLDTLLAKLSDATGRVDMNLYREFRGGLLRHIGIEEKILLPAAQRLRGGKPLPIAERIRLDHGALVALLVPPPTPAIIATIRSILLVHNRTEEEVEGLYEAAESAVGDEAGKILDTMRGTGDVRTLPNNPDPKSLEAARRAVERAGYAMKE